MKLGSFEINRKLCLGAFEKEQVVDLNAAYKVYLAEMGVPNFQTLPPPVESVKVDLKYAHEIKLKNIVYLRSR